MNSLSELFARVRTSADVVFHGVGHRTELAALELAEARKEAALFGLLAVGAAVALLLVGFTLTLAVAAAWWDTPHRVVALAWTAGGQALLGAAAGSALFVRWRRWRPFSATQDQLRKDSACLHALLNNPSES